MLDSSHLIKYQITIKSKKWTPFLKLCRMAEWSKAQPLCIHDCGFEPLHGRAKFCHFCPFFQTLRSISQLGRSWAISGPFLYQSTCSRELLELSLIHVLSRALCVSLVWKIAIIRSKNDHFLPFSYS